MKFIKKLFILSTLGLFLLLPNIVSAIPYSSTGWVNPNYNDSWTGISGIAEYKFYIEDTGFNATKLELAFESDIFDLSQLTASDFTVTNPISNDWTTTLLNSGGVATWGISQGTTMVNSLNDPLTVTVNYTLLNSASYYYGNSVYAGDSTLTWAWNEAQGNNNPWSQEYMLSDFPNSYNMSGGSTAPIPEPGTILLLGAGLAGIGFYTRRKKS